MVPAGKADGVMRILEGYGALLTGIDNAGGQNGLIPLTHPRYESLRIREMLAAGFTAGAVAVEGPACWRTAGARPSTTCWASAP